VHCIQHHGSGDRHAWKLSPKLRQEIRLRIFGITRAGLIAITLAVAGLWSCIGMEAITRRHADQDERITLQTLWKLRQNSVPVSVPAEPARRRRPISS
jgi:hypothetical protein